MYSYSVLEHLELTEVHFADWHTCAPAFQHSLVAEGFVFQTS